MLCAALRCPTHKSILVINKSISSTGICCSPTRSKLLFNSKWPIGTPVVKGGHPCLPQCPQPPKLLAMDLFPSHVLHPHNTTSSCIGSIPSVSLAQHLQNAPFHAPTPHTFAHPSTSSNRALVMWPLLSFGTFSPFSELDNRLHTCA